MATVIRSAQFSNEQVTLPTQGRAAAPAQAPQGPQGLKAEPLPMLTEQGEQAPQQPLSQQAQPRIEQIVQPYEVQQPPPQLQQTEPPVEDPADLLRAELERREKALVEREREFEEELESERRRVSEEAYREGFESGEQEAMRLYGERLDALRQLIESLKKEFAGEIAGLEDVVVSIAFEAVCKIVGEAMHDTDGVLAVVRMVMAKVKDQEKLVLHVSPQDYNLLYQSREELFGGGHGLKHELVSDDRVALGGCLIETSGGTIDGRLEIQMQQLRDALIGARKMLPE